MCILALFLSYTFSLLHSCTTWKNFKLLYRHKHSSRYHGDSITLQNNLFVHPPFFQVSNQLCNFKTIADVECTQRGNILSKFPILCIKQGITIKRQNPNLTFGHLQVCLVGNKAILREKIASQLENRLQNPSAQDFLLF